MYKEKVSFFLNIWNELCGHCKYVGVYNCNGYV